MDNLESDTIEVYRMRQRTNWEGPDSIYDAWLLLSNFTRKWFDNVAFLEKHPDWGTLRLQFHRKRVEENETTILKKKTTKRQLSSSSLLKTSRRRKQLRIVSDSDTSDADCPAQEVVGKQQDESELQEKSNSGDSNIMSESDNVFSDSPDESSLKKLPEKNQRQKETNVIESLTNQVRHSSLSSEIKEEEDDGQFYRAVVKFKQKPIDGIITVSDEELLDTPKIKEEVLEKYVQKPIDDIIEIIDSGNEDINIKQENDCKATEKFKLLKPVDEIIVIDDSE